MEPEPDLIREAQAGDRRALEALIQRYQARLFRLGRRLCGNSVDAEDVLQETLLTLARSLQDFRGDASLSTWLFAVARSHCIKRRRASKFAPDRLESLDHADLGSNGATPAAEVERRETLAELERAFERLDDVSREVVFLRDVEGFKATEVAEVLEMSVAAVKSRLHRGRRELRDALERSSRDLPPTACPDVISLFSRHLEGELDPSICARMESHLEGCARCRSHCEELRGLLAMCRSSPSPEVPQSTQQRVRRALDEFLSEAQ